LLTAYDVPISSHYTFLQPAMNPVGIVGVTINFIFFAQICLH
jgi:hypothetical protein